MLEERYRDMMVDILSQEGIKTQKEVYEKLVEVKRLMAYEKNPDLLYQELLNSIAKFKKVNKKG